MNTQAINRKPKTRQKRTTTLSVLGILAAVVVLAITGSAHAGTITAVADSKIAEAHPNTNYGTTTDIRVRNNGGGGYSRKSYIKFDLSGLNADPTKPATLTLTFTSQSGTGGTVDAFGLDSGVSGYGWGENSITWSNAPGNVFGHASSFEAAETTFVDGVTVANNAAAGTTYDFTLSSLGDFLQSDDTVTLMLRSAVWYDDNHIEFASREHTTYDGPKLTYTVVPEPGSLALLGLGGLCLLGLRRRRQ